MKSDLYSDITSEIVKSLESGIIPWRKGWSTSGMTIPTRQNGKQYRGINSLILWIVASAKGYSNQQWMTYNQASAEKAQVRKGEKGTRVVYFNFIEKEDEQGNVSSFPLMRGFTVFNVAQIDNLPAKYTEKVDTGVRSDEDFDAVFNAVGANVQFGGIPQYMHGSDSIMMPEAKQFENQNDYYATLAHELIHWTGHESRLNRSSKDTDDYAFEELVAELGSLFLNANLGITADIGNSAAYIQNWLSGMQNNKKFVFQAASAAQKAVDYVLEKAGLLTVSE